ncbi:MAG: hypothetical protein QF805_22365, partial [Pirellulaceae bacterium]|nr:hypothetical protein [Pirellulaceae bacterium]
MTFRFSTRTLLVLLTAVAMYFGCWETTKRWSADAKRTATVFSADGNSPTWSSPAPFLVVRDKYFSQHEYHLWFFGYTAKLFEREGPVPVSVTQPARPCAAINVLPPQAWASTQFPAGNIRTQRFLAWSKTQHWAFCAMELDANGDCIELHSHPCLSVRDDQLKVISLLDKIESLWINAPLITDEGLRHLEGMPALTTLSLCQASSISENGLARLMLANA